MAKVVQLLWVVYQRLHLSLTLIVHDDSCNAHQAHHHKYDDTAASQQLDQVESQELTQQRDGET